MYITSSWSGAFCGHFCFLHQENCSHRYNCNIIESVINHLFNPNPRFCISMLLSVIKPFPDDIKELYDMKLSPGHIVAFSNECSSASKRLTLMKVGKHIDFVSVVYKYCKLI